MHLGQSPSHWAVSASSIAISIPYTISIAAIAVVGLNRAIAQKPEAGWAQA